jgi:hypothetical protein
MYRSFFSRLSAAALVAATLTGPVLSQSQRSFHNDVLPPTTDLRAHITAPKSLPGKSFGSSEPVAFTTSSGTVYQLTRFHGLNVDILLPETWTQALSKAQIRNFLDHTDLIYQQLLELVGTAPLGADGPVQIVVVPEICGDGLGCALLGHKGVMMDDDPYNDPGFWQGIAADYPNGVLIHELTHNFDVYSSFLEYGFDRTHDWTTLITNYYAAYTHEGFSNQSPEEAEQEVLDYTNPVFRDPTTTWEDVMSFQSPYLVDPPLLVGGFGFQVALRYGPQTVTGFTSFMSQYAQSHSAPATDEEKNDLYLEALAAGAHRELGCVADAWHWHITDSLRQTMLQLYGPNPDCVDHDHDGFSVLQGDCDDHKASVHPGALEHPNRLDDDCNGLVDEHLYRESRDLASPLSLILPASVTAALGSVSDQDDYKFHLKSPGRVELRLCPPSLDSDIQLNLYDRTGGVLRNTYVQRLCSRTVLPLGTGDWHFRVEGGGPLDSIPGGLYSVSVKNAAPWPLAPWAKTAPPRQSGNGFVLTAATANPKLSVQPTQVRFWVSGQGFVGTVPYERGATFSWTPPPGVDPVAEGLTYRAQVMAGGVPAAAITPPQEFAAP